MTAERVYTNVVRRMWVVWLVLVGVMPAGSTLAQSPASPAPPADAGATTAAPAVDDEEEGAPDENPDMLEDDAIFFDEPAPPAGDAAPADDAPPAGDAPPAAGGDDPAPAPADAPPGEGGVAASTDEAPLTYDEEDASSWSIVSSTTLGLSSAMAATVVTALVALLANPAMVAYVGVNFFAPRVDVPVAGGTVALPVTLLVSTLYAAAFAAPLAAVAAAATSGLGALGLVLDERGGWAAAGLYLAGGVAGGALAALSGALMLGGVAMLLQVQHLDVPKVLDGQTEVVYLEPVPAIFAGSLLLVGGFAGVAAPLLAASVGNAVAQFAPDETAAATTTTGGLE